MARLLRPPNAGPPGFHNDERMECLTPTQGSACPQRPWVESVMCVRAAHLPRPTAIAAVAPGMLVHRKLRARTPMPSSHCPNTAFTPLPRRPHTNPRQRRPHAPTTQPPCHLHAAPTPPPSRPSCAAMPCPHRPHTATTLQQRRCNVTLTPLHAALTLPSRTAARSSHAALMPSERLLHAVRTPLAHRRKAAAKQPSRRCSSPLRSCTPHCHVAITQPSSSSRRCTPLLTAPPPRFFAVHNAPTPPQRRRKAALTPLHVACTPLHAASHSSHAG